MGGPGQLFSYKELKSLNEKDGDKLKRDAKLAIEGASSKDIARVIIVVREDNPEEDYPKKTGKTSKAGKKK